jgi:hypothetical protein
MTEPQPPQQIRLSVDWSGASDIPVAHINQFIALLGPPTKDGPADGIYLILGSIVPPIIFGDSPEARQKSIDATQGAGLKVDVYGRYHLSRERLKELIESLQTIAHAYDAFPGKDQSKVEAE